MSSEYEKQLETRIGELEKQLADALKPKDLPVGAVKKAPLSLTFENWTLTGIFPWHPQAMVIGESKRVIFTFDKVYRSLFRNKIEKLEYVFTTNGEDKCLTTGKPASSQEDVMLRNIFHKCVSCGYIEYEKNVKGEHTEFIRITDKWKEL